MAHGQETRTAAGRIGRRGLLGIGAGLLVAGWGGTALFTRAPGLAPAGPAIASVGLWLVLFVLVAAVAVTQCPRHVTFSRPILVWVSLNVVAFCYTGAALAGLLPASLAQYAYWHIWLAAGVVGFTATGVLLRRAGASGSVYLVAAVTELWMLVAGLVSFETLVPGLYLLVAVVHPMPLAIDALDSDFGDWPTTVAQVTVYTTTILAVILS